MADIAGGLLAIPNDPYGSPPLVLFAASLLSTVTAGTKIYFMQAKDSVTLATYHWELQDLNLSGFGYPGPNAATAIAVAGTRIV